MRARPLARMLCLRQVDIHSFFREICKKPDYLIIRTINLKWEHNHWHGSSAFSPYHPHLPLLLQRVSLAMTFTSPLSHFYFHTFTSTHSLLHFHSFTPDILGLENDNTFRSRGEFGQQPTRSYSLFYQKPENFV